MLYLQSTFHTLGKGWHPGLSLDGEPQNTIHLQMCLDDLDGSVAKKVADTSVPMYMHGGD